MARLGSYTGGLAGFFLLISVSVGFAQQKALLQKVVPGRVARLTTISPMAEARKVVYQITWHGKKGRFGFRPLKPQEVALLEADRPASGKTVTMPAWRPDAARVDITTYIRQYAGVTQQGKKLIYDNAFDPGFLTLSRSHVPDWRKHAFVIATGVYRATYDPQARRFTDFSFNGPA